MALRVPNETTLLLLWLRARGMSPYQLAQKLRVAPSCIKRVANGRRLPSLILAFKIEQETEGGVPAASWLGTTLGRFHWGAFGGYDWRAFKKACAAAQRRYMERKGRSRAA